MENIILSRKQLIKVALILFLLIALPLTLYLVRQTQIFKPRALGGGSTFTITGSVPPGVFTAGIPPSTTSQFVNLQLDYRNGGGITPTTPPVATPTTPPSPTVPVSPSPSATPPPTPTSTPGCIPFFQFWCVTEQLCKFIGQPCSATPPPSPTSSPPPSAVTISGQVRIYSETQFIGVGYQIPVYLCNYSECGLNLGVPQLVTETDVGGNFEFTAFSGLNSLFANPVGDYASCSSSVVNLGNVTSSVAVNLEIRC